MHPSVAQYSLSKFLPQLLEKFPGFEVNFIHDLSRKITEQVISRECDLALVINPVAPPDLIMHKLLTDDVTLFKHPRVDKYVVSDTLSETDLAWGPTTVIRGADLIDAVTALRRRPGRDVNVMGSSQLARSLLEADLVDELNLMIEPIVLGGGKTIFPSDGRSIH
jgi:DNA-binding transcriptional LysR family regulator